MAWTCASSPTTAGTEPGRHLPAASAGGPPAACCAASCPRIPASSSSPAAHEYHNKGASMSFSMPSAWSTRPSASPSPMAGPVRGHGRAQRGQCRRGQRRSGQSPGQGAFWISSHHVYNQPNDPILNACQRLGLDNRPENHVQVIFDPAPARRQGRLPEHAL